MLMLEVGRSDRLATIPCRDGAAWSAGVSVIRTTEAAVRRRHRSDIAAQLGCPHEPRVGLDAWSAMRSMGKLAVGQTDYSLEQAHGAVTRAVSVRSGVEDYYLGGPEAAGAWIGSGTRPLGLQGKVDADRLDRVLAGEHPVSGEPLGRVVRQRVPGFDLTFSAPKSVSVLFGVGD